MLDVLFGLSNYCQTQGPPPPPRPRCEVCNLQSRDDTLTILSIGRPSSPIAWPVYHTNPLKLLIVILEQVFFTHTTND